MDASLRQILSFDSSGRFLRAIGKAGDAPGEFVMLGSAGVLGDTVWIADPRLGRITLFSRSGQLLRTLEESDALPVAGMPKYSLLGLLGDGSRLIALSSDLTSNDAGSDKSIPFLRVTSDGRLDTLFRLPVPGTLTVGEGRNAQFVTQPFDERPTIGVRRDGGAWIIVERSAGDRGPAAARVTHYSLDGLVEWSREIPLNATRIPSHVRDSIVDEVTRIPDQAARLRGWLRVPRRLPLVPAAMLSDDGSVWLNEASRADTVRWIRLDSAGNPRGALFLRRTAQILYASESRLWMLERETDGVPAIVRYSVR
jgi:hypothetical protein